MALPGAFLGALAVLTDKVVGAVIVRHTTSTYNIDQCVSKNVSWLSEIPLQ